MPVGPIFSWTDPRSRPESIADIIYFMDWKEAPLLNILGFNSDNHARLIPDAAWPAIKPQWLSDTLPPNSATLSAPALDSDTVINLGTGEGAYFRVGDLMVVKDTSADNAILETVKVTAVAADTVTVSRNFPDGGTGVAWATGDVMMRYSTAKPELSAPDPSFVTQVTTAWNGVQIIEDTVTVSRSEQIAQKLGIQDAMQRRIEKRFVNGGTAGTKAQELENTFFYGQREERTETENGSIGGFDTFVTTNIISAGGNLTEDLLREMYRTIYNANGMLDFMLMNPRTCDEVDKLYMDRIRTTVDERRGGSAINSVFTSNGECYIIPHRHCPEGVIYFVNREKCGWVPYDPFFVKQGNGEERDGMTNRIIGEYTFVLFDELSFGKITGITYS